MHRNIRKIQHYCPQSQPYAGGHILQNVLADGWQIIDVQTHERGLPSTRHICIYDILLHRDGNTRRLRLLENPYIRRVVRTVAVVAS